MVPPPSHHPEDHSYVIRQLSVCLIVISTLFLIARLYARLGYSKNAGIDDGVAVLAWVSCVAETSMKYYAATKGTGRHMRDLTRPQIQYFFFLIPTLQLLYIFAAGCVRLAIVTFLPRINKARNVWFRNVIIFLAMSTIFITIVFFVVLLTSCKPFIGLWYQYKAKKCFSHPDDTVFFDTHQALGSFLDLCLLGVPIWLVYSNMRFTWRTLKVALVFSVGLFLFVVGIIRFVVIYRTNETIDTTWYFLHISLWSSLEIHIGFWVCCFPALVPLIRVAFETILGPERTRAISTLNFGNSEMLQSK